MKIVSLVLGVLSLGLIGVLFYLHFNSNQELKKVTVAAEKNASTTFRIAYFDIDSLQANYEHYKDALEEMKRTERSMNAELENLKAQYQRRIGELQKKGPTMTQAEGEAAQRELGFMDNNYRKLEAELQDKLQNRQMDLMKKLRSEIESYLAEYNRQKDYAYIFSYEPGFLLYYKDSAYDITAEVVQGLNERYKSTRK